ncbi:MAG: hypothetical protein DME65_10060 [Verrucomicrobia bacterium]|nr:MAG: hypothetical protein DME65_10060 [Verrucomicrobiota bacterium]
MHLPQRCCTNISLRAHHDSFSNRTLIAIHQQEQTMKTRTLIAAMAVSAGLVLGPAALAQEETPVEMKDVPSPAQTTIKEKAGTDQIVRVAKETRKGKECYDAVVNKNGKEVAIRVDSNGKFLGTHPEKAEQKAKTKGY